MTVEKDITLEEKVEAEKIAFSLLDIVTDGVIMEIGTPIQCPYLGVNSDRCHLYNRLINKAEGYFCVAHLSQRTKMYITKCRAHIDPSQIYDIIDENLR